MIKPGELSVPAAAELNRLMDRVRILERLTVSMGGLQMNRGPSGTVITATPGQVEPDPLATSAVFVDVVHVVGLEINFTFPSAGYGYRLYTVRRVDRNGTASPSSNQNGTLRESTPVVEYTGVYEAQNRNAVVDPPGSQPTHELNLYLDKTGCYYFQIDQNADGDWRPGPGFATDSVTGDVTDLLYEGHVSGEDQVMGDGVKGFRRGVVVNLARDSQAAPLPGPVPVHVPALNVLPDTGPSYAAAGTNALRVFPGVSSFDFQGRSEDSATALGTAVGMREQAKLTGLFPLTVDGQLFAQSITYRQPTSYDQAAHGGSTQITPGLGGWVYSGGGIGGSFTIQTSGSLGTGTFSYGLSITTVLVSGFGPPQTTQGLTFAIVGDSQHSSAYSCTQYGTLCRGIEEKRGLYLLTLGGGWISVDIAGGLWWRYVDQDGNWTSGNTQAVGVGAPNGNDPGVGGPAQGGGIGAPVAPPAPAVTSLPGMGTGGTEQGGDA